MRTMAFTKKGNEPLLELRRADTPKPASGEVLVKVKAVSLNAADYRSIQMGMVPKSRIFGADVAGTRITSYNVCYTKLLRGATECGDCVPFA